ncbi:MAG: T9SS type B sorting domain-containing protein, partial [Pricia sp.]
SSTVYTETNFAGGNYTINVYDDNGCVGTTTATIAPFDELLPATITVDQAISCVAGENITINAFGSITDSSTPAGLANYEFRQLPSGTFAASNTFTNLPVGNHNFEVRNVNTNCVVSVSHTVNEANNFEITATTVNVECHGTDGSVTFAINDPVNPYSGGFTYRIFDSQGTAPFGDDVLISGAPIASANVGPTTPYAIGAGEYRVEIVQDSNPSCTQNEFFTIAGPSDPITANTQVDPITCVGNDGVIEIIDVLGGWGDYNYYVGTVAPTVAGDYLATPRFTTLGAGTYQAWVIDQNGCQTEVQSDIVLADPTPISATLQINSANCTNFEGEIEVSLPTGGQGSNYIYQLIKDGTPIRAPQNTRVFTGLDAGNYEVQITDQWTCTFTTSPAEIVFAPVVPLATVDKTIDCSATPGGQITITQTGGSGNFRYDVKYPLSAPSTVDDTNTTGVFAGLIQPGDYIFTITDTDPAQACSTTVTQRLEPAVQPIISLDTFTDVTCNGANDGTITVSAIDNGVGPYTFEIVSGSGSSPASPITATSSTATTATFTGLPGTSTGITYTVRATGTNSCFTDIDRAVVQPDAIANVNATVDEFGCSSGNNPDNATITIDEATITGGSGNYVRYEFINTTTSTTVQDGPNTSYTETDVAGGSYTITVYDGNGCVGSTTATILPFIEISNPDVNTTQEAACAPLNNGEIEVGVDITPATATPTLEYTVTGIGSTVYPTQTITSTNNPETFTGLEFGTYSISITNVATGCVINTVHKIDDPDTIEAVISKLSDEECLNNGIDEGSFGLTVNGYTGPYNYQVFDNNDVAVAGFSGSGDTSTALPPITGLSGGVYYVRVTATGAPRCDDDSNYVTILAPRNPITAIVREEANVTCSNDQGKLFVDPTGGKGPYTINLENTTTSQTYTETNVNAFIFENLNAGDYHVTVTDNFGCVLSDNIELIRPNDIVATITQAPLTCFDGNTAEVTATLGARSNPTAPIYEYRLNRYDDLTGTTLLQTSAAQGGATFSGLAAGFYSISVADQVSCSDETTIIEIINPTEVEALLIRTSPLTCTTGVELELSATGGASGSYEYRRVGESTWTAMPGSSVSLPTTGIFDAGEYQYQVRDAVNGCAAVQTGIIDEDPIEPLTLTVNRSAAVINCNGESTAVISARASGGRGDYQYSLYSDASLSAASRIEGPKSGGEFDGLPIGTYYVHVTSDDCPVNAEEVIITEPDALSLVNPDDFTNVTCQGASDGTITVELSGGTAPYQYAISPNLNQFSDDNMFIDLAGSPSGIDYTVIAQDSKGCFIELTYTIVEPAELEVSTTVLPEICQGENNGSIDLTITGGTAPYSTRLSTETSFVQDRTVLEDLASGDYIIFIEDANGCSENVLVTVEPGVNLNAAVETIYGCEDNIPSNYINIVLENTTIADEVMYALDSTDPADMQLNPFFRDTMPGSHYIAISHANGCIVTHNFETEGYDPLTISVTQSNINELTATVNGGKEDYTIYFGDVDNGEDNTFMINRTDTYVVRVIDDNGCEATANIYIEFIDIEIPNFFTPNGDGENQFWKPRNDEGFPQILTIIFDRYGREVYRIGPGGRGWDGFYQQTELPTGDYWYIIKLNGENDDREFVGHFTLYR